LRTLRDLLSSEFTFSGSPETLPACFQAVRTENRQQKMKLTFATSGFFFYPQSTLGSPKTQTLVCQCVQLVLGGCKWFPSPHFSGKEAGSGAFFFSLTSPSFSPWFLIFDPYPTIFLERLQGRLNYSLPPVITPVGATHWFRTFFLNIASCPYFSPPIRSFDFCVSRRLDTQSVALYLTTAKGEPFLVPCCSLFDRTIPLDVPESYVAQLPLVTVFGPK